MENWSEISQEFVESLTSQEQNGNFTNVIHSVVLAYAGSANCNPKEIPHLYASLFALFKKGELNMETD